jgi:alkylation response protein AidB-like acyl-CoA dehydrogenase
VLGNVGDGFIQAMKILDGGRISIASLSIGIAKGAYEAAVKYANEREQFGQKISSFQGISFKLADMATKIQAAELLTRNAAYLKDHKKPMTKEGAMAKYYASEVAVQVSTDAVQVFGTVIQRTFQSKSIIGTLSYVQSAKELQKFKNS